MLSILDKGSKLFFKSFRKISFLFLSKIKFFFTNRLFFQLQARGLIEYKHASRQDRQNSLIGFSLLYFIAILPRLPSKYLQSFICHHYFNFFLILLICFALKCKFVFPYIAFIQISFCFISIVVSPLVPYQEPWL